MKAIEKEMQLNNRKIKTPLQLMTVFQKKKINLIKNKMIRKIKKVVHIHQTLKNQKH